jgi:hypothetical protein
MIVIMVQLQQPMDDAQNELHRRLAKSVAVTNNANCCDDATQDLSRTNFWREEYGSIGDTYLLTSRADNNIMSGKEMHWENESWREE